MQANLIASTLLDDYYSEYWTLSDAASGARRFPVGYRRGSPSDAAGNELTHMHESFLVGQPCAQSDHWRTYTSRLLLTPSSLTLGNALLSDTVNHHTLSNSGQSLPAKQLTFSTLQPESLTHPGCELPSPVRWQRVPPGHPTLPFHLHLSDTASEAARGEGDARGEADAGEVLPARQPYHFKPLARRGLPVRHSESWSPVGRRQGDSGQTTLPFPVPHWRRLLFWHSGYCAPVGHRKKPQITSRFFLGRRDWPVWFCEYWPPIEHRRRSVTHLIFCPMGDKA